MTSWLGGKGRLTDEPVGGRDKGWGRVEFETDRRKRGEIVGQLSEMMRMQNDAILLWKVG